MGVLLVISSQEMQLLGELQEQPPKTNPDVFASMRAFYVELATYVNVSHSATCRSLVSFIPAKCGTVEN